MNPGDYLVPGGLADRVHRMYTRQRAFEGEYSDRALDADFTRALRKEERAGIALATALDALCLYGAVASLWRGRLSPALFCGLALKFVGGGLLAERERQEFEYEASVKSAWRDSDVFGSVEDSGVRHLLRTLHPRKFL